MAIAREDPASEGDTTAKGPPSGTESADAGVVPAAGRRMKKGGPRTAKGKEISSRNATSHGILSESPTVGDERLEDWEAHLAGMQQALQPVGQLEAALVLQIARNRWQRSRLDRWNTEMVQNQIDGAAFQSRDALDLAHDCLPEDEAVWSHYDAEAVLAVLESMSRGSDISEVDPEVGAGVLLALEIAFKQYGRVRGTDELEQLFSPPETSHTGDELRRRVDKLAGVCGAPSDALLDDARAEADAAALYQAKRAQQDRHRQATRMASAYVLDGRELDKYLRYGSQLEREFDRTLNQLETVQLARQGVASPRLRLDVAGDES